MRGFTYVATLVVALGTAEAQAAIGLKCSQWLDARAYVRFDPQTKQFLDERPRTVRPVSQDVDTKMAWANWYLSGHIAARILFDRQLENIGAAVAVSVERTNPDEVLREATAIDNLCRNGLLMEQRDYDVAELIDLRTRTALVHRATEITTMLERSMEEGRRLGAQSR